MAPDGVVDESAGVSRPRTVVEICRRSFPLVIELNDDGEEIRVIIEDICAHLFRR